MIPSNKADRCLSATTEMLSRFFEIPNLKFPLLVSKLFHLLSQPTPPPPLSHNLHQTPSLIPWLAWLLGTARGHVEPWPQCHFCRLAEFTVEAPRISFSKSIWQRLQKDV